MTCGISGEYKSQCQLSSLLSSSSSSSSSASCDVFVQPDALQCAHVRVHSMSCFLHVHLVLLQSVWQVHLMTHNSFWRAGGRSVWRGTSPSSLSRHPHSVARRLHADLAHSWTRRYTHRLWYFAASEVGGKLCGCTWARSYGAHKGT